MFYCSGLAQGERLVRAFDFLFGLEKFFTPWLARTFWAHVNRIADSASGPPALGVHVLMGETAPLMLKNVNMAIVSGGLIPTELVATAD